MLRGAIEVVEHGQQPLRDGPLRAIDLDLALLVGPATVVRVLGLNALEVVQELRLVVALVLLDGLVGLLRVEDLVDRQIIG